jgi:hypothetical protein
MLQTICNILKGKLISTIFETVDQIKPTGLSSIAQSRDWYSWSDQIDRYIGKTQNYQLYSCRNYIVPALHLLLAQNGTIVENFKIQKQSWDMFKKTQDNQNILKMMSTGLNLITRSNFSGNQLITQLPLLLRICQPSIRSVNPALWSKNEKVAINHCVNVMVDLGLSLKQTKNMETQLTDFEIEPPVVHVAYFPSDSKVKQMTLTNSTKTLLAAEIER